MPCRNRFQAIAYSYINKNQLKREADMVFRLATLEDVSQIMPIMEAAVARMLREGKQQWDETYPALPHSVDDVVARRGVVLEEWGKVRA